MLTLTIHNKEELKNNFANNIELLVPFKKFADINSNIKLKFDSYSAFDKKYSFTISGPDINEQIKIDSSEIIKIINDKIMIELVGLEGSDVRVKVYYN